MYIFDIDGTLLDTIDSISYYVNKALEDFGLGQISKDKVRKNVGNGPVVLIEKCLRDLNIEDKNLEEKVLNHYNTIYDDNPAYLTKPYPQIKEELEKLKASGEFIAAFSNKPDSTCKKVLSEIWDKDYFDFILGFKEDVEKKPSSQGIHIIANRFNQKMSDIMYLGDSEVDIKCGKNANIFTIACSWGFREREYLESFKPDFIIDKPNQITSIRRV